MQTFFKRLTQLAPSELPVVLTWRAGPSKRRVARAIHLLGPRRQKPFVVVDCAELGAACDHAFLSESSAERLGHKLFGWFTAANGGTLLLDRVDRLPMPLQRLLPRLIEYGELPAVENPNAIRLNVRVIATTDRDLQTLVMTDFFREDLYYRLAVLTLDRLSKSNNPDAKPRFGRNRRHLATPTT